jgi:phospholipase C
VEQLAWEVGYSLQVECQFRGRRLIEHVFVLMLENRSFDHMLGFSGIEGTDAKSGSPTSVNGLDGSQTNQADGHQYVAASPAPYIMDFDPGHGFADVLEQLGGAGSSFAAGGKYPKCVNTGFAANARANLAKGATTSPGIVMAAFAASQLPILNTLAREFAVCDAWHSSLPGPTWPNRMFVHAATSGGLDDSPTSLQSLEALLHGYRFANGTIYDQLDNKSIPWSIVEGDALPQSLSLGGMVGRALDGRFISLPTFLARIEDPAFSDAYTFIEPNYGHVLADGRNFKCGDSQHPLDDVTRGERLVKTAYEAVRNSPHWLKSLMILMYDEHGGFYDHVPPPRATAPGDNAIAGLNRHGFTFEQLGVRIPAVIISPYIERGVIDHTVYDHASVPATLSALFNLPSLTQRDKSATTLGHLLVRSQPRDDAPVSLPEPAQSGIPDCEDPLAGQLAGDAETVLGQLEGPLEPTLTGFMHVAVARQLQLEAAVDRDVDAAIQRVGDRLRSDFQSVTSKLDAARFLRNVELDYQAWQRRPRS